ncbi:hypothetical protein HMPREF1153_1393 [Selenomonas sp. CM52]|nr:hypothetical protein HMPREF1153_1393 [Selenomonas sp. CM52]
MARLRLHEPPISIHAPAWGATRVFRRWVRECGISIHAPAWGATDYRKMVQASRTFQSTRPRGARLRSWRRSRKYRDFNPRARVGRDRAACERQDGRYNFNPRARVGRDPPKPLKFLLAIISIHAPAWGATHRPRCACLRRDISIHAPAWGATGRVEESPQYQVISIHAPAWGATGFARLSARDDNISIHAPAWGATMGR